MNFVLQLERMDKEQTNTALYQILYDAQTNMKILDKPSHRAGELMQKPLDL